MASQYTPQDLIAQTMVAFGQGTGYMRVSHEATRALLARYETWIEQKGLLRTWETDAVQILERIRAIGRLAALRATQDGRTAINAVDVRNAVPTIETSSATEVCGDTKP